MYTKSKLTKLSFAAIAVTAIGLGLTDRAQAESPFHTGVWQFNTPEGPRGWVASDWLIFDGGLPNRWLYRRAGTNVENQFNYYSRTMGQANYAPVGITVQRTGDNTMQYTLAEKGKDPVIYPAVRLSVPDYAGSCLSVENKGARLFGRWTGTKASSFKKLRLSKNKLTIDGNAMAVDVREVRVGRLGIIKDGQPFAFFTDAGGDYAVLQKFNPGVTLAQMTDPQQEILSFASEEIAHDPKTNCDQQIAARLKLLGKK